MHDPCGICSNTLDEGETVKLRAKGADTINKASTERGTPSITVSEGQTVHIDCRKKHVNTKPNRIPGKQNKCPEKPALRSQTSDFCFSKNCFFVAQKSIWTQSIIQKKCIQYAPSTFKGQYFLHVTPGLMSGLTLLEAELTLHAIFQQLTQYITSSAAQISRHIGRSPANIVIPQTANLLARVAK